MADELEFKDKVGNLLKRGDLIVYGVAYGRSAGLSFGVVLGVTKSKSDWRPTKPKIRIHGVDAKWGASPKANSKVSFLEFSERVLRIDRALISAEFLAKLDQALSDDQKA